MCGVSFISPIKMKNRPSRIDRLLSTIEPIRWVFAALDAAMLAGCWVVMAALDWWLGWWWSQWVYVLFPCFWCEFHCHFTRSMIMMRGSKESLTFFLLLCYCCRMCRHAIWIFRIFKLRITEKLLLPLLFSLFKELCFSFLPSGGVTHRGDNIHTAMAIPLLPSFFALVMTLPVGIDFLSLFIFNFSPARWFTVTDDHDACLDPLALHVVTRKIICF